jgi:hypothetical protein
MTNNRTVAGSDITNSGGSLIKVLNIVPEVSSQDRMHVMDEGCWCKPHLLFVGDRTMKIDHQREVKP